jgi:hypothetical protein
VAFGGWMILGTAITLRSTKIFCRLSPQVEKSWGEELVQVAPSFAVQIPGSESVKWIMPIKNSVNVELKTDYRKKGLIWYPTYKCMFAGDYTVTNSDEVAQKIRLDFKFPSKSGTYDDFSFMINGESHSIPIDISSGIAEIIELNPDESKTVRITYTTRGIRQWKYMPDDKVGRVQGLALSVKTDFMDVDYPLHTLSPMSADRKGENMFMKWEATDLITKEGIGVIIPERLNPGPLTSRITYFAPVCLLFFFVMVAAINIIYKVEIHPMHYLFVAAGFFAFHLLLSYMVGIINIHVAFIVSAVVSVTLVTSYMYTALKGEIPLKIIIGGQLFYLVLFSYTFLLKGVTGLTIAIGSVATLAVMMKVTANVDWNEVFAKPKPGTPCDIGRIHPKPDSYPPPMPEN